MKKLIQTRLNDPPLVVGNCFPTVIACFLDMDSPEDCFQFQEIYDSSPDWMGELDDYLTGLGWDISSKSGHDYDTDSFYLVSGKSPRNPEIRHMCIYQRGKLWHDPHPTGMGITTEDVFFDLRKDT